MISGDVTTKIMLSHLLTVFCNLCLFIVLLYITVLESPDKNESCSRVYILASFISLVGGILDPIWHSVTIPRHNLLPGGKYFMLETFKLSISIHFKVNFE